MDRDLQPGLAAPGDHRMDADSRAALDAAVQRSGLRLVSAHATAPEHDLSDIVRMVDAGVVRPPSRTLPWSGVVSGLPPEQRAEAVARWCDEHPVPEPMVHADGSAMWAVLRPGVPIPELGGRVCVTPLQLWLAHLDLCREMPGRPRGKTMVHDRRISARGNLAFVSPATVQKVGPWTPTPEISEYVECRLFCPPPYERPALPTLTPACVENSEQEKLAELFAAYRAVYNREHDKPLHRYARVSKRNSKTALKFYDTMAKKGHSLWRWFDFLATRVRGAWTLGILIAPRTVGRFAVEFSAWDPRPTIEVPVLPTYSEFQRLVMRCRTRLNAAAPTTIEHAGFVIDTLLPTELHQEYMEKISAEQEHERVRDTVAVVEGVWVWM